MNLNRLILLLLFVCILLPKDKIFISFKNDEGKIIKNKKIKYTIKRHSDGEKLKTGKFKSKNKNTLKFDFKDNKKVKTYGSYDIVFEWTDEKDNPHENTLRLNKDWFIKTKFKLGSISDDQKKIGNKDRKISIKNKGRYPYSFTVPLRKKSSIIEGWVYDEKRNPIQDVSIQLDYELNTALNLNQLILTNSDGYFRIEAIKKNNVNLKSKQRNGIILIKQDYNPNYFMFPLDKVQKRSTTKIEEIILKDKNFKPTKLICDSPRVWSDECSDCVCTKNNHIWYNELNVCAVAECPENKILGVKNGKVVCSEPIILATKIDYIEEFEPLSEKIIALKFLDSDDHPITGLSFSYDNNISDEIAPFEGVSNIDGIITINDIRDNNKFCMQSDPEWECDTRLNCLNSYIWTSDNFKDTNNDECFDYDEKLIDDFKEYNVSNLFYLNKKFSKNKNYIEKINDIKYNGQYYSIDIEQNKIYEIKNSDIIALTYTLNNGGFKLKKIDYLDAPSSESFTFSSEDNSSNSLTYLTENNDPCSEQMKFLKNAYINCSTGDRDFSALATLFNNYTCGASHLNDYMKNIYFVNYLFSDIMNMSDEDFLEMYITPKDEINIFEFLDIIFSQMNTLISNPQALLSISEINIDPYIANIYRKEVEFYYKYVELLFTMENKLFQIKGTSERGPRMYIFNIEAQLNTDRFIFTEDYDTKCRVYEKLESSLDGYKLYSEKAGNWGNYIKTVVTGIERKMKWIRALYRDGGSC